MQNGLELQNQPEKDEGSKLHAISWGLITMMSNS